MDSISLLLASWNCCILPRANVVRLMSVAVAVAVAVAVNVAVDVAVDVDVAAGWVLLLFLPMIAR